MKEQQRWKAKTGPKRKGRTAKQFTVTLAPEIYDELMSYMESHGLSNRSGTIATLIKNSLPYA